MSSSDVALRITGLSKSYTIRHQAEQHITLAEHALSRLRHPLQRAQQETFWALRDIDLEVKRGEVLGIIGRNGAGKSTLLKILSRITAPTTGRVELYGRLGSLLEVGTGFHPELTGRENVYLNGTILGMKKSNIDSSFDEIVEFAGVEKFLDTPVKRYSSGMYVRLAFAVAAHLDTEILVIDEVLAVGDLEFQERCMGKMGSAAKSGKTVLLVSHNLNTIEQLCAEVVVLDAGQNIGVFPPSDALKRYSDLRVDTKRPNSTSRGGSGQVRVTSAEAPGDPFHSSALKVFSIKTELSSDEHPFRYFVSVHVVDSLGRIVLQVDSRLNGMWIDHSVGSEANVTLMLRTPWLKPGTYHLDIFLCNAGIIDSVHEAVHFEVLPSLPYSFTASEDAYVASSVFADFEYRSKLS